MRIIILISILFCSLVCYTQEKQYNLPENKQYTDGIISLLEFNKYEAKNLQISNDTIYFTDKYSGTKMSYSLSEINYLRVQTGNQAGTWALYGGLLMTVSSLLAIIEVASGPYEFKPEAPLIIIGAIGGGIVIGGLIGSAIPKYKTYYVNLYNSKLDKFDIGISKANNYIALSMKYTF